MGGTNRPSESPKVADQSTEKRKGFVPWVNLIKPVNEEKDHWVKLSSFFSLVELYTHL